MSLKPKPCPNEKKHTKCPDGLSWNAWAAKKSKTHRQIKCGGCGLFKIWIPKKPRAARAN